MQTRPPRTPLATAAALAFLVLTAVAAQALPSTTPASAGMVDGPVRAIAQAGNVIWVGGAFGQILDGQGNALQAVGDLAAFDATTGAALTSIHMPVVTWSLGTPTVYDLSLSPDGILYLAGEFDAVDGQARWNVAAIDPATGALLPFAPHVEAAMTVYAGPTAIYVGGQYLNALRPNGTKLSTWTVPQAWVSPTLRGHSTYPDFRDITQVGGTLVVACVCDKIYDAAHPDPNGVNVKAVVQIDAATGLVSSWAPGGLQLGPSGSTTFGESLVVHTDPVTSRLTIYLAAGGNDFTGAFDFATGTNVWKTDTSGSSQAIAWYQGDLIVGGHFDWTESPTATNCQDNANPNYDCYHTPKLVAMDPSDGSVMLVNGQPWNPGVCCKYNGIWALQVGRDDATVHVGGEFTKLGGTWQLATPPNTWQLNGGIKHWYYGKLPGPTALTHPLTVSAVGIGDGSGTVTSDVGAINCGTACSADVAAGTAVTLTATADAGYSFLGWEGDCAGSASACHLTMDQARNVVASFGLPSYPLNIYKAGSGSGKVTSDVGGINCGAACSATLTTGSSVTLTATAVVGSVFTGWSGDCGGTDPTCVLTVDQPHAVTATFAAAKRLTVTPAGTGGGSVTSDPTGIDCGATCSFPYALNTVVTLTATPDANSTFAGWSGKDAAGCVGTGPCQITMSAQRTVTATFDPILHQLSAALAGDGTGTVTSDVGGIACGAACSTTLQQGTVVTLTAAADPGSVFTGWSGDCAGTSAMCAIALDADHTATATFRLLYDLSATPTGTGGGAVTADTGGLDCGTTCTAPYASSTVVTLTATPDAGSSFDGWGGDCSGTTSTCQVTMVQAHTVTATFTEVDHVMSVALLGDGTGGVTSDVGGIDCGATCSASIRQGTAVSLTATPTLGATFTGWGGDCSGTGTCELTMDGDHSVTATFVPAYQLTVSAVGAGGGTIADGDPNGIVCGTACSHGYLQGTTVTLTAAPDAASVFAGWSGDCAGTAPTCDVLMDGDHAATATFDPVYHQLSVTPAGDGTGGVTSGSGSIDCGATCSASIRQAAVVTLTAAADPGSIFTGWTGDCSGTADTCQVTMDADHAVGATFMARYALDVATSGTGDGTITGDPGAIDCGTTCTDTFTSGTVVTLTATAGPNATFAGWSGDPSCSGTGTCVLTMDAARSVTADFEPIVRQLRVAATGSGRVTSAPSGIDCGTTCTAGFVQPTSVTLTASPAPGWFFSGWGGDCAGSSPTCQVSMGQDHAVTATFAQAAPCGRLLFTTKRGGNIDVWSMNADGSGQTRMTSAAGADGQAAWSPDCARIAFVSSRTGSDQIYVMNADGTGTTQLTSSGGNILPAWSPDGTRIAFVSDRAGGQKIFVMNADGSSVTLLSQGTTLADTHPDWSPDGTRIVFTSQRTGGNQVWVMNADGSNPVRITKKLAACVDPAWSPDGTRIAVICKASGTAQVWTVTPTGGSPVRVSTDGKSDAHPAWSPDGTRIAFSANVTGWQQIWCVNAAGGAATNLSNSSSKDTEPGWD